MADAVTVAAPTIVLGGAQRSVVVVDDGAGAVVLVGGGGPTITTNSPAVVAVAPPGYGLGPPGPPGPPGPAATTYVHTQNNAAATWVIVHNLDKYPSVAVVDSGDTVIYGDVRYNNANTITLTFSAPFSGAAYLN